MMAGYRSKWGALVAVAAALVLGTPAQAGEAPQADRIAQWWSHVEAISNDSMEGRLAGSPGYGRAAEYVEAEFRKLGIAPAGTEGYRQPVALFEQRFDAGASKAKLIRKGPDVALSVPGQIYFRGSHSMPGEVDAPLVFAGYGLSVPEAGHDDFRDLDVRGKVVVVLSGGPDSISGALKSDARADRARLLAERGAVGVITLTSPAQVEIPWERQVGISEQPSMYLADPMLRAVPVPFMAATFNPAQAELLFAGSGRSFAELAALSDSSQPLPVFDLPGRLKASIAAETRALTCVNLVGVLPGRDGALANEYVVLSAHLDGLGIGKAVNGDTIYNGTFDNAVGVASLLDAARQLARPAGRPRRSILFAIVTAEEKGLLGSRYFAKRPTVPVRSIVANINLDMPLPIFPLTSVTPIGYEESSLGADAQAVAAEMGLPVVPDPFPNRNVFTRSDQYSFIKEGIPALFLKYGFAAGTPEAEVEKAWRANIYHSPQDDLNQPVLKAEAVKLNDYLAALTRRIANSGERPVWNSASYFKRFAKYVPDRKRRNRKGSKPLWEEIDAALR